MMQVVDTARLDAYVRLLAQPDPADLPPRAQVCRYAGDPDRRSTRLPGILMAWLQQRHLARDPEQPMAPPVSLGKRHWRSSPPPLHLLRPTGTG